MSDSRPHALRCLATLMLWMSGGLILAADPTSIVGIEGHYRVGCWTGVRYTGSDSVQTIETRDGDGVQVQYQQSRDIGETNWGYVIPGSEAAPLILSGQSGTIETSRFPAEASPSRGPAMIPLQMPWIVVLGDPLSVEQVGANKLLNRDALIAVSIPKSASGLPDAVLGYEGVDMMMINASGADLLKSLDRKRREAIEQWIKGGGHLFL
ncbi:MAG: hypothetical protein ACR2NZ_00435, partial [Rubripirellula sp.]